MNVFTVVKQGIYRHDLFGTYDEQEKAIEVADRLAEMDCDSYHSYDVIRFNLNMSPPIESTLTSSPRSKEFPVVYQARRKNPEKIEVTVHLGGWKDSHGEDYSK